MWKQAFLQFSNEIKDTKLTEQFLTCTNFINLWTLSQNKTYETSAVLTKVKVCLSQPSSHFPNDNFSGSGRKAELGDNEDQAEIVYVHHI